MRLTKRGKKRLLILFLLTVFAIGAAGAFLFARSVYRDQLAQDRRESGMAAYAEGDYRKALSDINYYFSRNDDDLEALLVMAASRARVVEPNSRHVGAAVRLYENVLLLDPNNQTAIEALTELYARLGRLVETELYAKKMLEIDSTHTASIETLVATRRAEGDFTAALGYADQLCVIDPNQFAYRAMVLRLLEEAGRPANQIIERAAGWLREATEDADGRWHMLMAAAYQATGRYNEMMPSLQAAADLGAEPDLLPALLNMLDLTNQRALTNEVLARATQQYVQEAWIHELTIRRHWEAVRFAEANEALEFALKNVTEMDSSLVRWQALLAIAEEDEATARAAVAQLESGELADNVDERDADRAWARTITARLDVETSGWNEALDQYEQSLAMLPSESVLHFLAGEAYLKIGEIERAAHSYGRASELQPMWVGAGLAHADALLRLGRVPEAFETAQELCRRTSPTIVQPWITYLRAWIEMERTGRPIIQRGRPLLGSWDLVTAVDAAYEASQRAGAFLPLLADAYAAAGLRGRQETILSEALSRDDLSSPILLDLARLALRDGVGNPASLIDRAEMNGVTVASAALRADLLRKSGQAAEGLEVLELAQSIATDDETLAQWQRIRATYLATIDHPDAAEALLELMQQDGAEAVESASMVLGLSTAWKEKAIVDRAIEVLSGAVGENSDRVQMAIASRTLRYEADDPQAVANSTLAMDDIVQRTPESLPARTLLAGLLMASPTPNPTEAIRHLRYAVDRSPGRYDLYPRLIVLLQQVGDFSAANQYLQAMGRSRGLDDSMRRTELALLEAQGDFVSAIARLSGFIDESSSEVEQLALASLHVRAGQRTQAESVVRALLDQFPTSPLTLQFAADLHAAAGRYNEGLALLQNSTINGGEAVRARLLGAYQHKAGYVEEAGELLQKAVELNSNSADAWLLLAQHYLSIGKQEEARTTAIEGIKLHPDNNGLQLIVATTSLVADEAARSEALRIFRELEGDNKALIATIETFGQVLRADGSIDTSDRSLRRLRDLLNAHPAYFPAARLAFMTHANAKRTVEALDIARSTFDRFPTSPEPAQWLVDLHLSSRRVDDAITAARAWRNRSLENPFPADVAIARLLMMREDAAGAVRTLEPHATRLQRDPEHYAQAYSTWLQALMITGQVDRAFALVQPVIEKQDELVGLWLDTVPLVQPDVAARLLVKIEPLSSSTMEDKLQLAIAWAGVGKRSRVESHFDHAMRLITMAGDASSDFRIGQCIAMVLEAKGEYEEAASRYRQVLAAQPENVIVLNNLAYMLSKELGRHAEAMEYSEKAITLRPEIPELLDTHAVVQLGNGQIREARDTIQRALTLRSDDATLLVTLGHIELAAGNRTAARQALDAAETVIRQTPFALPSLRAGAQTLRSELEASVNAGN